MTTTANYIIKAVVGGETYVFMYEDAMDAWEAMEQFWHDDYPEVLTDKKGSEVFPISVYAMEDGKALREYPFMFNAAVFHAYYDHGHKADGIYTLDEFAKDISRNDNVNDNDNQAPVSGEGSNDPKQIRAIMDRWAGFCYNHPPYDEVILWMVGGQKEHYLYQHFCQKWLHLCNDVCHNDTMATWIKFYRTLDSQWAERLMEYVFTNS